MYEDEKLVCEDCGKEFVFTAGEQEFYAEKGLVNKPKRCPDCRLARRKNNRKKRKMYDAVCSKCGAQTQVPFKPVPGREIFCKECFQNLKNNLRTSLNILKSRKGSQKGFPFIFAIIWLYNCSNILSYLLFHHINT